MFFIDSSAWVEYLEGSLIGKKVYKILNKSTKIYSLSIIISEVVSKAKRKNQNPEIAFRAITNNSKILEVSPEISKEAGIFHAEMKKKKKDFGLVDSIIWVICKKFNLKLVTCDFHFKDFKNVIFLN